MPRSRMGSGPSMRSVSSDSRRRAIVLVLAMGLTAMGCRVPVPEGDQGDRPDALGARPGLLAPDDMPPPLEGAEPAQHEVEVSGPDLPRAAGEEAAAAPDTEPSPDQASPSRTFRTVGSLTDARSDHGVEGPAYADVTAVTIEDDGASARLVVDMVGDIPLRLGSGEVMGVGVDLWSDPSEPESDYQLFADGGEDGWLAYLHTPRGFADFPGEFLVGGRRLVFEVAWDDLGALTSGAFATFVDWSQRRPALNAVSQDHAPDDGATPFDR